MADEAELYEHGREGVHRLISDMRRESDVGNTESKVSGP